MVTTTAKRARSLRLGDDDLKHISAVALGDETLSQTIRRVLREAAQRKPLGTRERRPRRVTAGAQPSRPESPGAAGASLTY